MARNIEERRMELNKIMNSDASIGSRKINYAGENKERLVFRIPMENLVLNKLNGRINTDVESWEVQNGPLDVENPEHERLLETWIWEKHLDDNKKTYEDLKQNGQKEPGQVTSDGIIVGGNRRATLLRKLGVTHFEAVIIKAEGTNALEILRLEKTLQHGVDLQVDYGATEKYLEANSVVNQLGGRKSVEGDEDKIKQVLEMLPRYKNKNELMEALDIFESMEEYLDTIGAKNYYKALYQKEDYLIDYTKSKKVYVPNNTSWTDRVLNPKEVADWRLMVLDLTRVQVKEGFRLISQKDQEGRNHVFGQKNAWKKTFSEYVEKVRPIIDQQKTLDDFRRENPENAEENWNNQERVLREQLKGLVTGIYNIGRNEIALYKKDLKPEDLLKQAQSALARMWELIENEEVDFDLETDKDLISLSNKVRKLSADIYTSIK